MLILHTAYTTSSHEHSHYNYYGEEYENTLFDEEFTRNDDTVTKQPNGYDITELIDDIPDTRTKGPIVLDYTIRKELNTVHQTVTTPKIEVGNKNKEDNTKNNNKNDKDSDKFLPIIKEYFNSLKKGIVDGFNSVIRKRNYDYSFDSRPESSFFYSDKVDKTFSYFAQKFYNALSRRREDVF